MILLGRRRQPQLQLLRCQRLTSPPLAGLPDEGADSQRDSGSAAESESTRSGEVVAGGRNRHRTDGAQ